MLCITYNIKFFDVIFSLCCVFGVVKPYTFSIVIRN